MILLGIDTSAAISAAIIRDDEVLSATSVHAPRRHAELLSTLVSNVIEESGVSRHDLDGIAAGIGPGPFTGLRVGLVTAQTFGYALAKPVYGIPSLDALALTARDAGIDSELAVLTDARRGEVYWARYAAGEVDPHAGPDVARLDDVDLSGAQVVGRMAPEPLEVPGFDLQDAQATAIARLAASRTRAGVELPSTPLYLRRPHVQMAERRKRATPGQ